MLPCRNIIMSIKRHRDDRIKVNAIFKKRQKTRFSRMKNFLTTFKKLSKLVAFVVS